MCKVNRCEVEKAAFRFSPFISFDAYLANVFVWWSTTRLDNGCECVCAAFYLNRYC